MCRGIQLSEMLIKPEGGTLKDEEVQVVEYSEVGQSRLELRTPISSLF